MRVPLSWLRESAAVAPELSAEALAADLVRVGLEVETVEHAGSDVTGPVVVGRVLDLVPEPQKNGKTINWCRVDVGEHNDPDFSDPAFDGPPADADGATDGATDEATDETADVATGGARGIVCGAHNFVAGDLVVVALPGSVLPGDFAIAARKTYGHVSDGMICSAAELGLGDDHSGIIVLSGPEADRLSPGQDAAAVLGLREDVLDIAVTPDRGYCWSVRGIAREAAQATGSAFTDPVDVPVPEATDAGHPVRLESAACPLFVAVGVTGLDPAAVSPSWLTRRLQLAGMRPVSLAVDVTNYVMLETGQPLHGYDAELVAGPIVVRQARPGERLVTLDDVPRTLDPGDLVIADDSGPIGLAGVMGGQTTELRAGATTTVVIEAAHFDAMTIARTSRRHRLGSEASRRFERGVDAGATYAAAHRAARLLVELGGARLVAEETVAGAVPDLPTQRIAADLPGRVMGAPIDTRTVVEHLRAVGVRVEEDDDSLTLTPPSWRPDLRDPYDYVEEVGRLYGYANVAPVIPTAPIGRGLSHGQRSRRLVGSGLVDAGFVEVVSFPFSSVEDLDRLGVPEGDPRRSLQRLANPLSETQPAMRTTLLPGLFAAVALNTSRSNDDLALYESGSVFFPDPAGTVAPRPSVTGRPSDADLAAMDTAIGSQPRHLAAVLTGQWRPAGAAGPAEPATWQHAIGFARVAARALGAELVVAAGEYAPWHPGRCAVLSVVGPDGPVPIGHAGELHPEVVRSFGLPARACAAELDLTALIAAAPTGGEVEPISTFPVVKEDVALVVDAGVPAAAVEAALREGAGDLLDSLRLFDVYTGSQIGAGQKSLAYALRFRAFGRTLTDAEVAAAREAAVARAGEVTGAVQRS